MNTHGVDVLHGTNDGGVVCFVPHDLVLQLLPAENGFFDEDLRNSGVAKTELRYFNQFTHVSSRPPSQATEGKGRTDQDGPTSDQFSSSDDLINGVAGHSLADRQVDGFTNLIEQFTVFSLVNGVQIRPDQFHTEAFKGPVVRKFAGNVEGCLSAHPRQERTRPFFFQYSSDGRGEQWFDVDDVRHFGVVLNRCRVGIDQNHLVAILSQSPYGL